MVRSIQDTEKKPQAQDCIILYVWTSFWNPSQTPNRTAPSTYFRIRNPQQAPPCWMHWNLAAVGNSRLTLQGMITYPLAELGTLESMIVFFAKLETLSVEDSNNFEGLYKRSIFISISFFMIQGGKKINPFETCFHFNVSECQGVFLFQKDTNGRSSILNSSKPIRDVEDPGSKFRRRADVGKLSSSSGWVIVINKKTQLFTLHFLGVWGFFGVPVAMNPKPSLSLKALFSGKGGWVQLGQPQARCGWTHSGEAAKKWRRAMSIFEELQVAATWFTWWKGQQFQQQKSPVLDDWRI